MDPELIKNKINSIVHDLRAEVLMVMFFNRYIKEENYFIIEPQGQFKRPFRKDVLEAQTVDYDFTRFLKVNLSRDGIYDSLPEGFFHYPRNDKPQKAVEEMTETYRTQKKEEEHARKFFLPYENEFFLQGMVQEEQEKDFLFEINGGKPLNFFYEFWGLEKNIPPDLAAKLIALLPYAYKIVGDLEATAHALRYMLREPVHINTLGYKEQSDSEEQVSLGDCSLGLDMISGSFYMDYSLHLECSIGPLENTPLSEYIHGGKRENFIKLFYEYFLPMEVDVQTNILLPEAVEIFDFSKQEPVLGYTTRI